MPWTRVTGPPGEGGTPGVVDQSTRSGATGEGDAWATKGRQCAVLTPSRGPIRSRAPLPRTGSRLARRWPPRARQPCAKAPRHRHGNRTHRKTGSRTLPGGQQPRGSAGPLDAAPEQQPTRPSRRTGRGSLRTGTSAPRKGTDPQENRQPAPHRRPPTPAQGQAQALGPVPQAPQSGRLPPSRARPKAHRRHRRPTCSRWESGAGAQTSAPWWSLTHAWGEAYTEGTHQPAASTAVGRKGLRALP